MSLQAPEPVVVPLYAGFWRRAAASFLDGLILIVPGIAIGFVLGQAEALGFLLNIALGCAYFALFHSSARQATPGKMAFGIKVTDLQGERIGIGRGLGRYFASWLSWLVLFIGMLLAAFTLKKQALHDMISGTLVVNAKADPAETAAGGGAMPITGGVMGMIAFLVIVPFFGGIAAAVAIPAYVDFTARAKVAETIGAAGPLKNEIGQAFIAKRPFATGAAQVSTLHAQAVTVTPKGEILVKLVPGVGKGGTIVHTPEINPAGKVIWRCASTDVPKKYLPVVCRD